MKEKKYLTGDLVIWKALEHFALVGWTEQLLSEEEVYANRIGIMEGNFWQQGKKNCSLLFQSIKITLEKALWTIV